MKDKIYFFVELPLNPSLQTQNFPFSFGIKVHVASTWQWGYFEKIMTTKTKTKTNMSHPDDKRGVLKRLCQQKQKQQMRR